jgi:hypothetical protein
VRVPTLEPLERVALKRRVVLSHPRFLELVEADVAELADQAVVDLPELDALRVGDTLRRPCGEGAESRIVTRFPRHRGARI